MKVLFIPGSVIGGLLAGQVGKKIFDQVWGVLDEEEPPMPKHREAPWGKVIVAAMIQGAIFKGTRAVVDRGTRGAFASLTGSWPGEQRPEKE